MEICEEKQQNYILHQYFVLPMQSVCVCSIIVHFSLSLFQIGNIFAAVSMLSLVHCSLDSIKFKIIVYEKASHELQCQARKQNKRNEAITVNLYKHIVIITSYSICVHALWSFVQIKSSKEIRMDGLMGRERMHFTMPWQG